MAKASTPTQYGFVSKLLHWTLFLLVSANFILITRVDMLIKGDARISQLVNLHRSIGVLVLLLAALFIYWEISHPKPALPKNMNKPSRILAKSVHGLMFLLLLALPISGYVMSTLAGKTISFFGLFNLPVLLAANKPMAKEVFEVHGALAFTLLILVLIHVAASFYHHLVKKDNVLVRMLPFGKA